MPNPIPPPCPSPHFTQPFEQTLFTVSSISGPERHCISIIPTLSLAASLLQSPSILQIARAGLHGLSRSGQAGGRRKLAAVKLPG